MKIEPNELEENGYVRSDELNHDDLTSFLKEKNQKSKGFFTYAFVVLLFIPIPILSYFFTYYVLQDQLTFMNALLSCLLGVGLVFLFIPIHELLHALAYKLVGADNISFLANLKKFYFAAIADQSVLNVKEFKIVALFPFLTVIIGAAFILPFVNEFWWLALLSFVSLHTLFCGGDFSLLNFMQRNKSKGMLTFDDRRNKKTYFYVKKD
jgi:hypothetical protein